MLLKINFNYLYNDLFLFSKKIKYIYYLYGHFKLLFSIYIILFFFKKKKKKNKNKK